MCAETPTLDMTPTLGKLISIQDVAPEIKVLRVEVPPEAKFHPLDFKPGNFAFVSAFGVGEAPFGISALPSDDLILEFAVQRLGSVTTELHELGEEDIIGIRGPLGNHFPMEELENRDILVLGGGIGGAPLKPVIEHILRNRENFGSLTILWAARSPELLLFKDHYDAWRNSPNTSLHLTVDESCPEWDGKVGLITQLLTELSPSPKNTTAITCGPPVMIYYADKVLTDLGFAPEQKYVTLEARMHCGIGKCGRCNLGEKLVCVDGPVFNMAEVSELIESFH